MPDPLPFIFDAHLDLAMNALEWNRDLRWPLEYIRRRELGMQDFVDRGNNTVCLPEMRRANVGLCVATQIARTGDYFYRLHAWSSPEQAWAMTQGQLAWYRAMESCGELVSIRDRASLDAHLARWNQFPLSADPAVTSRSPSLNSPPTTLNLPGPIGYILSLEGADSILSFKHLEQSHDDGLRALGLAHYGPGVYAHGTDDHGPLPSAGRELLRVMDQLALILDVTHLCDESFWDALEHFSGPVWASHHNCRALASWNRQLADDQIRALIDRGAVIGMAFDAIMMIHHWKHRSSRPQDFQLRLEKIVDHIDHICQLAGNAHHVGIGTDLDGGFGTEQTPMDLNSIADLKSLPALLTKRGYSAGDINRILHGNFIAFLRRHWK